jgi:hypothetical protein
MSPLAQWESCASTVTIFMRTITLRSMRSSLALVFALSTLVACASQTVDLGANTQPIAPRETNPDAGASEPRSFVGCVAWEDAKIGRARGAGCTTQNTCSARDGDSTPSLVTAEDVVAVTAGRWLFCQNDILSMQGTGGPPQRVVGLEFRPGCVTYALVRDRDGALVLGTEAGDQSSFDIVLERDKPPSMILHTKFRGDFTLNIESATCPNNYLRLHNDNGVGLTMQSAPNASPDAGPAF